MTLADLQRLMVHFTTTGMVLTPGWGRGRGGVWGKTFPGNNHKKIWLLKDRLLADINWCTNWCTNCVLKRVMDTVKETIADVSSASFSSERKGLMLKTSAIVSFTSSITLINTQLVHQFVFRCVDTATYNPGQSPWGSLKI